MGQPAVPLFRSTRRDFTYAVQGLLFVKPPRGHPLSSPLRGYAISALPRSVAPASLRSTLSRCGVISLGSSKKYSGGYEVSGSLLLLPGFLPGQCVLELLEKPVALPSGHL